MPVLAPSQSQPEVTIVAAQWDQLMGKLDALTAAIQGITVNVPPANLTPIVEHLATLNGNVRDLSYISGIIDRGYERTEILGRYREEY